MRLALSLGLTVSTLLRYADDEELELWEAWETAFGPLGPVRDDYRFASIVQATLAPHGGKLSLSDARVFQERDLRSDEEIHAEQVARERANAERMVRTAKAEARFAELAKQGRQHDFGKEIGPDGNWIGPVTG